MSAYKGQVVFEGYSLSKVVLLDEDVDLNTLKFTNVDNEVKRFKDARDKTVKSLDELYEDSKKKYDENVASLFSTHKLMAEDLDFEDLVMANISSKQTAELAVHNASYELAKMFKAMDDEYMKARAADAIEVGRNVIDFLLNRNEVFDLKEPSILITNDLEASLLMKFNKDYLKGLVLLKGNINSHVSIFARTLEIPTLVAVEDLELENVKDGQDAIIDCVRGKLILNPTRTETFNYDELSKKYAREMEELKKFIGKESKTIDGFKIKLYANINSANEASNAIKRGAEGVGLFRSEFIYLSSPDYPSEDAQFRFYKKILDEFEDKEVIVRTMDIGADKKVDYFKLPHEENPALGYRSIRICKDKPEMFLTQIKALYRASVFGKLSIMIPMIISVEEILFVKEIIRQAKYELKKENTPFADDVKLGIMIETPAAAIISDELGKYVDFFSIGTNDLSQYTLACDRMNPKINKTFNAYHPAILRLIKLTVENAHKNNIICGMCGELARDPRLIPFFAAIHIDELSCSSAYILKVRKALSEIDSTKVNLNKYLY